MAKSCTTNATGSLNEPTPADCKIDRDVGEHNAVPSHMTANNAVTYANAHNGTIRPSSRAGLIALWLTQAALAVMFLMAGGSKLAGAPAMISLFDALGFGQWFRYVTGIIELTSAIALLIPSAAVFGAILLIPTMLGAIAANVLVAHASPAMPALLLVLAAAVAWTRRDRLRLS